MANGERSLSTVIASWKVIWKDKELAVATTVLVVFLVLHVPPVKGLIGDSKQFRWFDLNVLLPMVLILILWQTVEITRRLEAVEGGIQGVSDNIHDVIQRRIKDAKKSHRRLDVLGLNLRYGWSRPKEWIDNGDMDTWTVRFSAYLPAGEPEPWTPQSWPATSKHNLDEIVEFKSFLRTLNRGMTVTAYSYSHTPPVHGYRLGNGDIYMAYVSWTGGKVNGLMPTYEFVPHSDKSSRAKAKRDFFNAWLRAAQKSAYGSASA